MTRQWSVWHFSAAGSMNWLFQFFTLIFCLGPGNMVLSCNSSTEVNGTLGESVTLPLGFPAKSNINTITWLHSGRSMVFITPKESQTIITDPERKHRINVTKSYSLQLSKLKMTDSGSYKAQIATNKTWFSCYTLRIFRRLSNLHVTNHTQLSKNGTCEVFLTCSVENPDDSVSFGWQETGNMNLKETNLTVYWDPGISKEQNSYTCEAKNPVSNISSSVSVQSLCKGLLEKPVLGVEWIIAISLIMLAVLLLGVLLLSLFFKKKKGDLSFSTQQTQHPAETQRNTEYASFSQGNTVYAQVTHSNRNTEIQIPTKNNDSSTIYSIIHQSKQSQPIS